MMAARNLPFALAIAWVASVAWVLPAAAEPPAHLVPFPEDAQEAPAKPRRAQPPKSNFRPRFRVPAVKQAQHLEPADVKPANDQSALQAKSENTEPGGQPQPLPLPQADSAQTLAPEQAPNPAHGDGRSALEDAYAKSKAGKNEADYTEIIELCQAAKTAGVDETYSKYAQRLLGWAHNRRGEARSKEGRAAEALSDFEAAVAASGAWRAVHNRGVSYAAAGRLDDAMSDLNRAIQLNPRYPHAYFNRGELRYKRDDHEGAIEDYTLAIRLGSREPAVYAARAHAYYRMQKFGDALRDYGEAIKREPENADTLINRADTYSDVGQYGEAAKDYRAAVRVAPENGRAIQAAAWLMATCPDTHYRDEKLAVDAARRAIELDGESYRNLSTLAAAQAAAEMFEEAQKTQEKAIAAAPKAQRVTAEKMMALYRREIPYRDRPFTAFRTPEEMDDKEVRRASAAEPASPKKRPPAGRRAWYQMPAAGPNQPGQSQPRWPSFRGPPRNQPPQPAGRPPKARLFAPRGRI